MVKKTKLPLPYHPANKAVYINPASTAPPAIQQRLKLPSLGNKRPKQSSCDVKTFRKLVGCFNVLNDPFGDIVFNRQSSRKRQFKPQEDVIHISSQCGSDQPTCCCCQHQRKATQILDREKHLIYNSPAPPVEVKKRFNDRLERLSKINWKSNARQYPLSAVCVRWRTADEYAVVDLYCVMAEYGQITTIDMCTSYSAIVVFSNLSDACRLVDIKTLGPKSRRLFCHWKHHSMRSRTFHYKGKGIGSTNNEMMHPTK